MTGIAKVKNVNIILKANVYFDGKVVSHTMELKDGSKKTAGIIYPGSYNFTTGAPERMDVIFGSCRVRLAGQSEWKVYKAGSYFKVPGKSSFDIAVEKGITEYLCSFN